MAWYTTEETLYFYETRRGLEPTETEQDAHLTLTLSTQEEYDRETGRVEQTQVQVDYAWSAGRPRWRGDDAITVTWDPEKGKGGMEKRLCCGCRPGIGRISCHPFLGRGDSRAGGSKKDRLPRIPCGQYEEKWQVLC